MLGALGGSCAICLIDPSDIFKYQQGIIIPIGIGIITGAITCYIVTLHKKHNCNREIVNEYNSSLSQSNINIHHSSIDLSLMTTDNGLGLRLTF